MQVELCVKYREAITLSEYTDSLEWNTGKDK